MAESVGNQNYQGLFLQWTQRFSHGLQVNANYTFSRSRDDAPEENGPGALTSSDPSNRATDRGASRGDIANVLNLSLVLRPQFHFENAFRNTMLNHNQIGVIMIADSGEAFNITTGDLNLDGVTGPAGPDRPVGIPRNSGRLPAYVGVDTRYSRYFGLGEKWSLEFYIEATNLFNKKQVDRYDGANLPLSLVDLATGILRVHLPDRSTLLPAWRDSRQVQLGIKFHF
jgi:TonB dependent receptor.